MRRCKSSPSSRRCEFLLSRAPRWAAPVQRLYTLADSIRRTAPQPRAAVGGTVEKATDQLLRQEAAARASGSMLRVRLLPQRAHTGGAGEDHFRRAESQYFRMLRGVHVQAIVPPVAVEYCFQPRLVAAFEAKRAEFDARYGRDGHTEVLLFHGTPKDANVESIVTGGFDMSKVGSTTDRGVFGAGAYLSEMTQMSLAYARQCGKMLMCRVLLGKPYLVGSNGARILMGKPCVHGYDSHVVDLNFSEVVIFNSAQILPCYILHLKPPAPSLAHPAHVAGWAAGMFPGAMATAAAGGLMPGVGGAGAGEPLGGVAGMSTVTPKGPHAKAPAVFNADPLAQAREFIDEQARKRQREADAAATQANMARAMELSKSTAAAEAAAAKDFEAQMARAIEESRAMAAAERARAAQHRK